MSGPATATTDNLLLGGRLRLVQPAKGHRAGTDAMLLIAAAGRGGRVADFGSGPGAIGLGLLALGRFNEAVLVERDPAAAEMARAGITLNGLESRAVLIEGDLTAKQAVGLGAGTVDMVVANPPYNAPASHRASPDEARAAAHEMPDGGMELWLKAALRAMKPSGRLVLLHRPEALPWLLPLLASRLGALAILPVHPVIGAPASRVILGGRRGSRAPARMRPALTLHDGEGRFTPAAAAIHAGEAVIDLW